MIPGLRHESAWELMATLGLPPRSERTEVEGFIDHEGHFLDRHEAYLYARSCGQLSATVLEAKAEKHESVLYSEDLY